jgi:hypothetical protein
MTLTTSSKLLHGSSTNESSGSGFDTATINTVSGDYIFPFILVQSGIIDNVTIGTNTPNIANFTNVTASTLQLFNNTITLSTNTNSSLQGIIYNTNQFFGTDTNTNVFTFKNTDTQVLGNANFNSLFLGTGTANISATGNVMNINTNGKVNLPTGTQAYRPTVERLSLNVNDTTPTTSITLDPNTNVSFTSVISDTPLTIPNTTTLLLSNSDFDGFVKIIHVSNCTALSTIVLHLQIQDPNTGILATDTITFTNAGMCVQIMYDSIRTCWLLLDSGIFMS